VAAVTVVEDDPNDDSVGYGGCLMKRAEVNGCQRDARPYAPRWVVAKRATDQGMFAAGQNCDGEDQSRDDRWRRGAAICGGRRIRRMNLLTEHSAENLAGVEAKTSFNWRRN